MNRKYTIWIIFFSQLLACSKSLQINIPAEQNVLVINAQWQQSQLFSVHITHSRKINDTVSVGYNPMDMYEVKNAFVTVKQNNIVIDTLKYDSVNYKYIGFSKKTALNNKYEINASAKGYVSVSTSSPLLSLLTINGISLQKNIAYDASGNSLDKISFNFSDNNATIDYYLIRVHQYDGNYATCINTPDTSFVKMIFNNPFTTQSCLDGGKLLLSDADFNGKTKQVVLYISHEQMKTAMVSGKIKRPYIDLLHITKDFATYIKSANNYDIAQTDPFAEPANVFSNVKNGYGFFTAYSLTVDTLR